MSAPIVDQQRIFDALLRNDFLAFVHKVFVTLNPGKRLEVGWYLEAMSYYLGVVSFARQPDMDRLIINLPPRMLKSTMVSVALPAFLLGRDPRTRIIVVTYSQELSDFFGSQTLRIMQEDWYKRVFPSTRLSPRKKAAGEFQTTRGGYRLATSTGATLTGRGGDYIVVDDPLKADDAWSDTKRQKSVEWVKSTLFSRLDDKRVGSIILTQQRLHEEDLSGYLIKQGGWLNLQLPAIAETNERIAQGPNRPMYVRRAGEALDPLREPIPLLQQIKRDLGTAVFSAQYQQSPTPADGEVIKLSWFKRYDQIPSGCEVIMSVDTASKVGQHNDFSVFSIWYYLDGQYYLSWIWRKKVIYPELKRKLIDIANVVGPHMIIIEDKVAGMGLIQDLRQEATELPVVSYLPIGDKITRMSRHSARIESGKLSIPREAEWLYDFELEVRQFPNGKHDDIIDSMSQMLDHHTARKTGGLYVG
ncbi:MAG: phage terminase large subunit, partial [Pontixanthobacter sp.]